MLEPYLFLIKIKIYVTIQTLIEKDFSMINIVLVDDQQIFIDGLEQLLLPFPEIKVIAKVTSGEDAFKLAKNKPEPIIMILDLNMPGMGGIEATQKIAKRYPKTKIIILTQYTKDPFPAQLMEMGAAGFLSKETNINEIVEAIRTVQEGKHYITPEIAKRLALKNVLGTTALPFENLAPREFQVMTKVIRGEKPNAIAKDLNLSPKTINSIRYRIFRKLVVKSDIELTLLTIRLGFLKINAINENQTLHLVHTTADATEPVN